MDKKIDKKIDKDIDKDVDKLFDWLEIIGALIVSAMIVFYIAFGLCLLVQLPFCVLLDIDKMQILKMSIKAGFVTVVVICLAGIREALK